MDVLRDRKEYEKAEQVLRKLIEVTPDDANLAAALVQVLSLQAGEAAAAGKTDRQRTLDEKALVMIRDYRKRYPRSVVFLQAECDLAARGGDLNRAIAITEEIDKIAPASTTGPMLRARLLSRQGKSEEVAKAYKEALERNPMQPDVRVLLGQELMKLRDADEALKQARIALDANKDRPDAILLEARALAETGASGSVREAGRRAAVERLEAAIAAEPRFREAYHTLADIELARGRRTAAIAALQRDLKSNPQDGEAVARLIQLLAGRRPGGEPASAGDLEQARTLAAEIGNRDTDGSIVLAAGVGYHKAGQLDLALPLSEKAATMLDNPVAHLNLGDLLLSLAESQSDPRLARPLFERAVAEYDQVLKVQPTQVEAANNKAWVLHTYLGRSQQAFELLQSLMKQVNAAALPGELYDTLGAIQETLGRRERCRTVLPVRACQVAQPSGPQLSLWQAARHRSHPHRSGQGIPRQGARGPRSAQPGHGPGRRGVGPAARPVDLGQLTARPVVRTGRCCSTEKSRFVTVTLMLLCRSVRAGASGPSPAFLVGSPQKEFSAPCD